MNDAPGESRAEISAVEHHWVEPTREAIEANVDLYVLTYEEAKRTLDDQAAELSTARTRAVQFLAFVGSATAFLAGSSIESNSRGAGFVPLAVIASFLGLLALVAVGLLLNPWSTPLRRRVEPRLLLETWIEREVPAPSKAEMLRELSLHFEDWREANESKLRRVRKFYFGSIIIGGLQLGVWAAITWLSR